MTGRLRCRSCGKSSSKNCRANPGAARQVRHCLPQHPKPAGEKRRGNSTSSRQPKSAKLPSEQRENGRENALSGPAFSTRGVGGSEITKPPLYQLSYSGDRISIADSVGYAMSWGNVWRENTNRCCAIRAAAPIKASFASTIDYVLIRRRKREPLSFGWFLLRHRPVML